jgi:DNA adenine methylase
MSLLCINLVRVDDIFRLGSSLNAPFLKWAGGKRLLVPKLHQYFHDLNGSYFEPFLGAGALFLNMPNAKKRYGNDSNDGLIEVYQQVRDDLPQVLKHLRKFANTKEEYLAVREWDRNGTKFKKLSPSKRAARFIFLNKTCFNGLYRVNSSGQFNVPFGDMKVKDLVNEDLLRKTSDNLNGLFPNGAGSRTTFTTGDFRFSTKKAKPGDGVYFDPPYDPLTKTSNFVAYSVDGFSRELQIALYEEAKRLTALGVRVLISNSSTPFINDLYKNKLFEIEQIPVRRSIAAMGASRSPAPEVLISNLKYLRLR